MTFQPGDRVRLRYLTEPEWVGTIVDVAPTAGRVLVRWDRDDALTYTNPERLEPEGGK